MTKNLSITLAVPELPKEFYVTRKLVEENLLGKQLSMTVNGLGNAITRPLEAGVAASIFEGEWLQKASHVTGITISKSNKIPDVDGMSFGAEIKAESSQNNGLGSLVDIVDSLRTSPLILNTGVHKGKWSSTPKYSYFHGFETFRLWEVSRLKRDGSRMATVQTGSARLATRAPKAQEPQDWVRCLLADYILYKPVSSSELKQIRKDVSDTYSQWVKSKVSFL